MNPTSKKDKLALKGEAKELFDKANSEYDAKRYADALALFDRAISSGLDSEVVFNNKGTALDALGRGGEAVECYKKATSINSSYELAWHNLGNSLFIQGLYDDALRAYAKASRLNPTRKENWSGLAASYARLSMFKKSAAAIAQMDKFVGTDPTVLLLQVDLYLDAGAPKKALERCETYIEKRPDDVQAQVRMGNISHEMGEYNTAIFAYGKALKSIPNDKEVWNNLGYSCFCKGYLDRALECFDKAIQIDPSYKHAWYNKGYAYHGADMLEEAVACYSKAISIDPVDKVLWNNLGNAMYNLGRYAESIPKFVEAIKVDPDYEIAWNNIGNALEKMGEYSAAIPYHDRSLEVAPDFDYALYAKGVCKAMTGELEEGYDLIMESLDINPAYDEAWKARSTVARLMGRKDEALMAIEQALAINPEFDEGWAERGDLLVEARNFEGAQASFETALKCLENIDPKTASGLASLVRRGEVLLRMGRLEESLANLESVALTGKMDHICLPRLLEVRRLLGRLDLPEGLKKAIDESGDPKVMLAYAGFLLDAGDASGAESAAAQVPSTIGGRDLLLVHAKARALKGDLESALRLLAGNQRAAEQTLTDKVEGEIRESKGDLFGAATVYKKELAGAPSDMGVAVALARVQLRLGEHRRAIETADIAIGIDRREWEPHDIKAEAYKALGEQKKADFERHQAESLLAASGLKTAELIGKAVQ